MEFTLDIDDLGRFVARIGDAGAEAVVTASNVPNAGRDLLGALADAEAGGDGECTWEEQGGDYRWMFKRVGGQLTVAVMWSGGTIMGWRHVFRTEGNFDDLARSLRDELTRLGIAGPPA